jgi:hypothetical protein
VISTILVRHVESPNVWFYCALDERNPTKAQEEFLHLNAQATNILWSALNEDDFTLYVI